MPKSKLKAKKPAKKTPAKKRVSKKKTQDKPLWKKLVKWAFVVGIWGGLIVAMILAWYARELPDITKRVAFERQASITVKAEDGTIIGRYGQSTGDSVSVEDLPPHLVNAILAIEDRRFYSHFGIDLIGLARAMAVNVKAGHFVQGGSTITQQLAKNLFLTREKKLKRKIQEAMLALWLEYELSKDEILSAYINRVYMGAGTYGMDAAAKRYFNKPVTHVDLTEAAMLAGLLKAPSRYSPSSNPAAAKERAHVVISAMVDAGYITDVEATGVKNQVPTPNRKPDTADSVKYFSDWVVDNLSKLIGTPREDLVVTTTMNVTAQNAAHAALIKSLMANGDDRDIGQGAVVMMTLDGAVIAMVGGRDYALNEFNRATQALRSPGSSFKPFVYLTALENGYSLGSTVIDEPFTTGRYRPQNFGNAYMGETNVYTALVNSLNTVAVRLAQDVGIQAVIETAKKGGITSEISADSSSALGSSGVSILELTTAYATLGNGGFAVQPYGVKRVETEDGDLVYIHDKPKTYPRVYDLNAINALKGAMRGVVLEGTGRGAATPFPVAGKTGTSQESRDALFAGFSDQLATVVWLGNDDNSPMKGVTGGSYPARIWREAMTNTRNLYPRVLGGGFPDYNYEPVETVDFFSVMDRFTGRRSNRRQPRRMPQYQYNEADQRPHDEYIYRHERERRYND